MKVFAVEVDLDPIDVKVFDVKVKSFWTIILFDPWKVFFFFCDQIFIIYSTFYLLSHWSHYIFNLRKLFLLT
jgi:hypothetical protein